MRHLARLTVSLCAMFILGATMVVWSGTHSQLAFERMFTYPDGTACAHCLFGIVPGTTTLNQAAELLQHHPLTASLIPLRVTDRKVRTFAGRDVVITVRGRRNGTITDVLLFFARNEPTYPLSGLGTMRLADAWIALKPPSQVSIGTDPLRVASNAPRNYATWRYDSQNLLLVARLRTGRMNASALLSHLHLSEDEGLLGIYNPLNFAARVTLSYDTHQWFGFVNVREYMLDAITSKGGGEGVRQALN